MALVLVLSHPADDDGGKKSLQLSQTQTAQGVVVSWVAFFRCLKSGIAQALLAGYGVWSKRRAGWIVHKLAIWLARQQDQRLTGSTVLVQRSGSG